MEWIESLIAFAATIQKSGLTPGVLLLAGVLFSITLILGLREFFGWYFKTHRLLNEIDEIKSRLERIEKRGPTLVASDKLDWFEDAKTLPFKSEGANKSFPLQR